MPGNKDLRKRITSVKNTQQTTRAMKMVSAAKLRRSQDAILAQRPYAKQIGMLIRKLSALPGAEEQSPLIERHVPSDRRKNVLLVLVTSDRGLCGGFNGNVIKAAQAWMNENGMKYGEVKLAFVGRRGHDFFKAKKMPIAQFYSEVGGKVTFEKARILADSVVGMFLDGQVDEVKFVYNEFKNAISQKVVIESYLPLHEGSLPPEEAEEVSVLIAKPSPAEVLDTLLKRHFAIQAYRILLESQAGEHGARMSAMENATKNAQEMIRKLTLQFNKNRQAAITKELLEIISGSNAQEA